ncbi:MAG: hypothetical protein ACMG6E_08215 [Candidatus Roizmanbacteria bacterium]
MVDTLVIWVLHAWVVVAAKILMHGATRIVLSFWLRFLLLTLIADIVIIILVLVRLRLLPLLFFPLVIKPVTISV